MKEKQITDIKTAVSNPVFWKRWNYPDGKEIRKSIIDLVSEYERLQTENDYLRSDIEFLKGGI